MQKYILVTIALFSAAACQPTKPKIEDQLAAFDRHLSHTLAYHYLWPWSQLVRAAEELDIEDDLEEPKIISDPEKVQMKFFVKRFKPEDLKVTVKNQYIHVSGYKKVTADNRLQGNHFVQRMMLPPGSKQEEVTAVYDENRVLTISVPKHAAPPVLPEREVPIEVRLPEENTDNVDKVEITTEKKESIPSSSATPLEQLDLVEATTNVGKIRKKDLKNTTKKVRDNEVTKGGESNGLDYALVESEAE